MFLNLHRYKSCQRCTDCIKALHSQRFDLLLGQCRHSLVDSHQLCLKFICIFHRHCLRQSINECLYLLHCCLLLIICPGVLRAGIIIANAFTSGFHSIGGFARSGIFRTGSCRSGALIGRSLFPRCRSCFCFLLLCRRVCFLLFFLFCHRISLLCECCHGQC